MQNIVPFWYYIFWCESCMYLWASSRDIINQMQWSMLLKRIVAFILWAVQLQMYLKDKREYKLNDLILVTVCISYGNCIP